MVKVHTQTHTHPYPFEAVTLAYYLRYPNPYSTHVLSTDIISRHYDPAAQTLYTARLHLKRSKIPSAVLKLLPRSWLGATPPGGDEGTSQSYILERSIVDVKSGVMVTESRNLEFTGVLKVVERQLYRRPATDLGSFFRDKYVRGTAGDALGVFRLEPPGWRQMMGGRERVDGEETEVSTKVELISSLGEAGQKKARKRWGWGKKEEAGQAEVEQPEQKAGFLRSWSLGPMQRSIEAIGLRRTERAVPNSRKGMNIVLDRLRNGGLVAALEGMRMDREMAFAGGDGTSKNRYKTAEDD